MKIFKNKSNVDEIEAGESLNPSKTREKSPGLLLLNDLAPDDRINVW